MIKIEIIGRYNNLYLGFLVRNQVILKGEK